MVKWIAALVLLMAAVFFLLPSANVIKEPALPQQQPEDTSPAAYSVLPAADEEQGSLLASEITALADQSGEENDQSIELNPEAVNALRDARLNGDPRTPPLNQSRKRDELPTNEELEDPQLYQQYERRQQNRMFRAYVEASKVKVAELEKMIERGRQEGISDEEIAFAERKIQGIEEMAEQLKRDHPEIMQQSYAPADDWLLNQPQPRQEKSRE